MTTTLIHLVTEQTHVEELGQCVLLASTLPRDGLRQCVIISGRCPKGLTFPDDVPVTHVGRTCLWPMPGLRKLSRALEQSGQGVVYAWGRGAIQAVSDLRVGPWVGLIADPADAVRTGKPLWQDREDCGPAGLVGLSERVRRRLVEAGATADTVEVIRPGIDFDGVGKVDRAAVRETLGIEPDAKLLLTSPPPSREGGQYFSMWGAAILQVMWPEVRVVVPGRSRERTRLQRFGDSVYRPEVFRLPGDRFSQAELLAASDALVAVPLADVPTGWIAAAMASGVPVVGSTVEAVTELIEDGRSGFLCEPGAPQKVTIRLRQLFEDHEQRQRCIAAARNDAARLFSIEACLSRHLGLLSCVMPEHQRSTEASGLNRAV